MASIDDQIPRIPQTEKDEIEEGSKVDHSIDIPDTNGQDPSGSKTKKSINEIYDEKFKNLNNSSIKSCTIFKVNVWLRESNPDAYTPKMVSIGPYHKKDVQLHPMESYKLLCLQKFLGRKEGLDVESCISELEKLKEKTINCYEGVEDDSRFCQMLLLDGCFVVEFIREYLGRCPEGEDKIFNNHNIDHIFQDLMLLENQLPFFILNKLHDMTNEDDESPLVTLLASVLNYDPFFVKLPEMTFRSFLEITGGNIKHLLHLIHAISCHGNHMKKPKEAGGCYNIKNILHSVCRHLGHARNGKDKKKRWHTVMQNATELSEAGVSFLKEDKFEDDITLFDIKFENGFMTIPCFQVDDSTETILRNLIAYEQQSSHVRPKYFSDFSTFMDCLIDSDKDVNLLRQKGIIENLIGDDKEVASMFNKMGTGVTIYDDFYYEEECRKAVKHCKKPWNKMKANLLRNYFSSPWAGASTVAAIILLILTTIQTILAFTGAIM